ncbi:MAG: transposase [Dehalococcoidia bacterium]|nr:transposase [Dehalococcoidia bacterium]
MSAMPIADRKMKVHQNLPKFNDTSYAHFVTTRTYESYPCFKNEKLAGILHEELVFYAERYGFHLLGYVIMPDHLHALIWWDAEAKPELAISKIMNSIKTMTSKRVKRQLFYGDGAEYKGSLADVGQATPRHFHLWQPGFYDFNIYTEGKLWEKLEYMHGNPVKAGLASTPSDYCWSSYKDYAEGSEGL